jgi:hypothetical protein
MQMLAPLGRIAALLLTITLAACQTLGDTGLVRSTVTTDLTPVVADAIAADMAGRLAEQIGPGNTTLGLTLDGSVFGQVLEASLKSRGYAIVTDHETGDTAILPLAYVVDDFEGSLLVRLSTPALELTRVYKASATGAEPVSPLSLLARSGESIP